MRTIQIGIIGPEEKNLKEGLKERFLSLSFEIGKNIGLEKAILITGGCSGIVEAACRGARAVNGITVGTPGPERGSSNSSILIEICTPINIGDYLFAGILSSDVIIVFPGDAGTVAEIAIAYRYGKPMIFLEGISEGLLEELFSNVPIDYPQYRVTTARAAVTIALSIAKEKLNKLSENR